MTAGSTTSGIDAALQTGGQISGTVTDASTHSALSGVCVTVYDSTDNEVGFANTDASGHYTVSGLVSGSYTVGFAGCGAGNYAPQFYNGKSSLATADAVSVTAGSTTSGIDAALQTGGQIRGPLRMPRPTAGSRTSRSLCWARAATSWGLG